MFVTGLALRSAPNIKEYPFSVPVAVQPDGLRFEKPITVLCGDNGCGKTTLMELLAAKLSAVRIGNLQKTEKTSAVERAASSYTILRCRREKRGFFFSAEDFIKYLEWREREETLAREELRRVSEEFVPGTTAYGYAAMPHARTIHEIRSMYDRDIGEASHGEGFLGFFKRRLIDDGLYLLDEPEAALSAENQYALALLIRSAASSMRCQFVVSTHSPILSAIPEADIWEISDGRVERRAWDELASIRFLKLFLTRRDILFSDED